MLILHAGEDEGFVNSVPERFTGSGSTTNAPGDADAKDINLRYLIEDYLGTLPLLAQRG